MSPERFETARSVAAIRALPDASTGGDAGPAALTDAAASVGSADVAAVRAPGPWPVVPLPTDEDDGDGGTITYSAAYRAVVGSAGRSLFSCRRPSCDVADPVMQRRAGRADVVRARLEAAPVEAAVEESSGGIFGAGRSTRYWTYRFEVLEATAGSRWRAGEHVEARTEVTITEYGPGGVTWVTRSRPVASRGAPSAEVAGSEWLVVAESIGGTPTRVHRLYAMASGRLVGPAAAVPASSAVGDIDRLVTAAGGTR